MWSEDRGSLNRSYLSWKLTVLWSFISLSRPWRKGSIRRGWCKQRGVRYLLYRQTLGESYSKSMEWWEASGRQREWKSETDNMHVAYVVHIMCGRRSYIFFLSQIAKGWEESITYSVPTEHKIKIIVKKNNLYNTYSRTLLYTHTHTQRHTLENKNVTQKPPLKL